MIGGHFYVRTPLVFRLEKKRRSACVGQADFGKLKLINIRKDTGNSQRLSMVNVINLKHDQLEINMAECSDLRAFLDGREICHFKA